MKLLHGVSNLRSRARCKLVLRALTKASDRLGTRLVEWSVQHDHIHIVVETKDGSSLSRAMHYQPTAPAARDEGDGAAPSRPFKIRVSGSTRGSSR